MSEVKLRGGRSVWTAFALGAVGVACASGSPITRPSVSGKATIVNEGTGKQYDDCRKAFAEATSDTVLTFSAGVFQCGLEVTALPDWLVVRGAGLGQTYLEASSDGKAPADLTGIHVAHALRVQDLSFGGLLDLSGEESRAELIRVGIATNRPALIGGPDARMQGSAMIVHSVLAGWIGDAPHPQPKPLAIAGNERVGVLESVLFDVEQEFERFPAPGTIVVLSKGTEDAFAWHEPRVKGPHDASRRKNVPCGSAKSPAVFCASEGQKPTGSEPLFQIASKLAKGNSLKSQEAALRGLGAGFADRFRKGLGGGLRQPDVFWFDDSSARVVQDEGAASGAGALAALAQSRLSAIVERCRHTDKPIATILESASVLDHLMKTQKAESACRDELKKQSEALVAECARSWDWDRVLTNVTNADAALDMKGASAQACREKFTPRLPAAKSRGPLADTYVRNIARQLQINFDEAADPKAASLVGVLRQMPAIITKSDRPAFNATSGDLLDRIIATAQMPGAGDGRRLVETTEPCTPPTGSVAVRLETRVALGELPPHARSTDVPRTVLELPVEVSRDEIPSTTAAGSINIALVKRCDEKVAQAYRTAVRRYVVQELTRIVQDGPPSGRMEAEVVLQMLRAEHPDEVPLRTRRLPTVTAVLAKLSEELRSEPLEIAPVSMGRRIDADNTDSTPPPPPDWSATDIAHAADVLSGARVVSAIACKSLLADVPWEGDESGVTGSLTLESASMQVRCTARDNRFELTFTTADKKVAKAHAALQRLFSEKLGAAKQEKRERGPALVWHKSDDARSGLVYKQVTKAGQVLGSLVVPVGSGW